MMTLPIFGQVIGRLNPEAPSGGSGDGWELVEDITVAADAQQVDITGLDGDSDELWMLVCQFANPDGVNDADLTMRFNADSGANYNWQFGTFAGAAVLTGRSTGQTSLDMRWFVSTLQGAIWRGLIAVASGKRRKVISQAVNAVTIFHTVTFAEWTNEADNLTQISIISSNPATIGAGSRIWLYRPVT